MRDRINNGVDRDIRATAGQPAGSVGADHRVRLRLGPKRPDRPRLLAERIEVEEGGKHYPSDVLFGAALGNFVAIFVHDAFLPAESNTQFRASFGRREVSFGVAYSF